MGRTRPARHLTCGECNRYFRYPNSLRRHVYEQHASMEKYTCPQCSKSFTRKHGMMKHFRKAHEGILENMKEEPIQLDPVNPLPVILQHETVSFAQSVQHQPSESDQEADDEDSSTMKADAWPALSCQDVGVQTPSQSGTGETGVAGQRIIERTVKELLDEDGKVVARVTTERFFVE